MAIALPRTGAVPSSGFLESLLARLERFRVRNHLRIVEEELRRKDADGLSSDLRRERSKNLDRLHAYWTVGSYPKNPDFLDRRVPYFKDAAGTPCAMAYLIEASGSEDLVGAVAADDNHVRIGDLRDGPVLEWIERSGLTQAEAARIQPSYGPCGFGGELCPEKAIAMHRHMVVAWIFFAAWFIVLEFLSFFLSSWLAGVDRKRRWVAMACLTASNLAIAAVFGFLTFAFTKV